MKKVIIIGATSGIGKEVARIFSENGYSVGITGRRLEVLTELQKLAPNVIHIKQMDIDKPEEAMKRLSELIEEMEGLDLIVISAGIGGFNKKLDWKIEKGVIDTNITGFAAITNAAVHYFLQQGYGHIAGISSVAALRGNPMSPLYSASKSFVSIYLESIRHRLMKEKKGRYYVTDLVPGFILTPMNEDNDAIFWEVPVEVAGKQIYKALLKRKKKVYIPKRWALVAPLFKLLPDSVIAKF